MSTRYSLLLFILISLGLVRHPTPLQAQLIPDNSLGGENSIVTPQQFRDLIEGGAIRGDNLFHSFTEFNVNSLEQVYFANPNGILNILTRVTGVNPSDIFGTLGVDGAANLILINPNGINFGADAQLDVAGSFLATTADSIIFDDGFTFSATNPEAPPLVTVNLTPGLQLGSRTQAAITNEGNLTVGQDLNLSGSNLFLSGQLHAGNNLTLQAWDTLEIRDSVINPFIADAGNQLLIQGNHSVDIFALNHPHSGLFSGGNLVLRSSNTIGGDAHYNAGGNFRIERLDGGLGDLFSPNDPVIRANGDVTLDSYTGASLHILAGGRVEIPGSITITGVDVVNSISQTITLSDGTMIAIDGAFEPTLDIRAGVENALGNSVEGTVTATPSFSDASSADISVGDISVVGGGRVLLTNQYQPNSGLFGDITVSSINASNTINTNGGGFVTVDSRGGIRVNGAIDASGATFEFDIVNNDFVPLDVVGNGGDITLIANGDINLPGDVSVLSHGLLNGNISLTSDATISIGSGFIGGFSTGLGIGGDLNLSAQSIVLEDSIVFTEILDGAMGSGGDINITTGSLSGNPAFVIAETSGEGNAGNITINASDSIFFDGESSGILSQVKPTGEGSAGDISITTGFLAITNGAQISSATFGMGNAGDVEINDTDSILLDGESSNGTLSSILSFVGSGGIGDPGSIEITTNSLNIINGARLSTSSSGMGNAGNINLNANQISLDGGSSRDEPSGIFSSIEEMAMGDGEGININTGSLSVTNGAVISSSTLGQGIAGPLTIKARDSVIIDGVNPDGIFPVDLTQLDFEGSPSAVGSLLGPDGNGQSGSVLIEAESLVVSNDSLVSSSSLGQGDSGNVTVNIRDSINISNKSQVIVGAFGQGSAGELEVSAGNLISVDNSEVFGTVDEGAMINDNIGSISLTAEQISITNNSEVSSSTSGVGDAGSLTLNAFSELLIDNSSVSSAVEPTGKGNAGSIDITTDSLYITNGAQISAATFGIGKAGDININATDSILLDGESGDGTSLSSVLSFVGPQGIGDPGSIDITTDSLYITNGARLSTGSSGVGNAGSINLNANQITVDGGSSNGDPSGIFSSIQEMAMGNGEGININTGSLRVSNGAIISSSTLGQGDAGPLTIKARDSVIIDGRNPDVIFPLSIPPFDFEVSPSGIGSALGPNGNGKSGSITIEAESLVISNGAVVGASALGQGDAGTYTINTRDSINISDQSQIIVGAFGQGNAGEVELNAGNLISIDSSGIFVSVNEGAVSNNGTGSIRFQADQISITNNSQISSATSGMGDAGSVTLNAFSELLIDNSSVSSAVEPRGIGTGGSVNLSAPSILLDNHASLNAVSKGEGDAGSIEIEAQQLTIQNSSQAIVSSASFPAGDIMIISDDLTLDQGTLIAETGGGNGGAEINLSISNLLFLGSESLISANATGSADGGNVNIEAQFIIAEIPTGNQGSDIVANAISGNGGMVTINSESLFGIEFQPLNTSLNDITASSESGAAGIVEILQPNINPAQELVNLGTEVVDATHLIVKSCPTGRGDRENLSQFIITGRSGLPFNPHEALTSDSIIDGWLTLEVDEEPPNSSATREFNTNSRDSISIVEAQSWMISANGKVILTASNNVQLPLFASNAIC